MIHRRIAPLAATLALVLVATAAAAADWARLGTRRVSDRVDHDEIAVGAAEGRFAALELRAAGSAVHVRRVVVHFTNGEEQVFGRDFVVPRRGRGPELDLAGTDRLVRRVSFTYDADSFGRRGAVVELWGRR